jgi:tetratricopeptide (TPR) repeat protein
VPHVPRSTRPTPPNRRRFQEGLTRAVAVLGGDRAAEQASGVSKSVWYDAKSGRAIPDGTSNWPAMCAVLAGLPVSRTGVRDWDSLYNAACAEAGRGRRAAREPAGRGRFAAPGFPAPLVGSGAAPQQLPPGTSHFAARDRELAALDEALLAAGGEVCPIVAVVGPPGVGKTALAVDWAHRAQDGFPDGMLYADLRGWGPDQPVAAAEVLPGWLRAFGVDPSAIPDDVAGRSAMLRTALAGKRLLVALDNALSEEQIRPLLPGSPSCSVLVTSRKAMPGLAVHHGAEVIRLEPLTVAESVDLLRGRVGRRVDQEPESAAELVTLCGRLPLALRVVAETARSRPTVTLASLVAELADENDRLDRLDGDDPRSDPRTVFSWSHSRLPRDTAATFRLLGLMPGGSFDSSAVAALTGVAPRPAARQLQSLSRAHLVQESAGGRFHLHDLVRLYAGELVHRRKGGESVTAARRRLFHYYLHTAHRADELVVPQRYRIRLPGSTPVPTPFQDYHGALAWLDTECATMVSLCRLDDPALDPLRWQLAFQLRGYFFLAKRVHEWVESHEFALAAAIRSGDRLGEAMTRSNLGVALHERGDDDAALHHYEIAHRLFAAVDDAHGVSNTLAHTAVIYRRRGEHVTSLRLNQQALEFYQRAGSRRNVAITLRSMALAEIEMDRLSEAERHLAESLAICAELDMDMDSARASNTLGRVLLLADRPEASARAHHAAIAASQRSGSRFEEALALRGLGAIAVAAGDDTRAAAYWHKAHALLAALGSTKAEEVLADLARVGTETPGGPGQSPD